MRAVWGLPSCSARGYRGANCYPIEERNLVSMPDRILYIGCFTRYNVCKTKQRSRELKNNKSHDSSYNIIITNVMTERENTFRKLNEKLLFN